MNGTGDGSRVPRCKEQYCIGTWNVRSMNQDKLEVVKQAMTRVNVDILGISEISVLIIKTEKIPENNSTMKKQYPR